MEWTTTADWDVTEPRKPTTGLKHDCVRDAVGPPRHRTQKTHDGIETRSIEGMRLGSPGHRTQKTHDGIETRSRRRRSTRLGTVTEPRKPTTGLKRSETSFIGATISVTEPRKPTTGLKPWRFYRYGSDDEVTEPRKPTTGLKHILTRRGDRGREGSQNPENPRRD